MNRTRAHQLLVRSLIAILAVIFILLPFHAFLTVWGSSLLGHYTVLRLWKEVLLVVAGLMAIGIVCLKPKLRQKIVTNHLWRIIALYILVTLVWAGVAYWRDSVTAKAALYGILINTRFLIMFMIVWVASSQSAWLRRYWQRLVAYPAALVVGFGLAQRWLLPYDVLRHFGYGPNTIEPYQTIDHKVSYLRVMS
ncbi:hypothetical protein KDA23_04540, partial [Candidatus Saccharibacteria bacterium]|nr:hypothetical protein [Candidatus Saccharibacteria bacterium]